MFILKTRQIPIIALLIFSTIFLSCATISPFNETAYRMSTDIKAAALALMDEANEPFDSHSAEVNTLLLEAKQAYEYAKGRPKNELSAQQWAIMIDPEHHMLAGFFLRWKTKGFLNKFFIEEARKQISQGFDQISGLESGKIKK